MNTTAGESYTYVFQLCGDAGGVPGAGIIQVDSKGDAKKTTVIGMYNATQAFGGGKSVRRKPLCVSANWDYSFKTVLLINVHNDPSPISAKYCIRFFSRVTVFFFQMT